MHRFFLNYAAAALAPLIAQLLLPAVLPGPAYMPMLAAVLLAAFLGGFGPGVAATAMAAFLSVSSLFPQLESDLPRSSSDAAGLALFAGMGIVVSLGAGRYRRLAAELRHSRSSEAALRESEERFRALTEAMPQLVWSARPDGAAEYLNRQWIAFTGLDLAATNRLGWSGFLHPDDLAAARECWQRANAAGTPSQKEVRYRGADGVHRWFLSRIAPIRDTSGRIIRWLGTATDIHDRRMAEEALQQSEHNFRAAFAHAPIGMVIMDLQGRYLHANEAYCRLVGYAEEELRHPDFNFQRLTCPDDLGANVKEMERMLAGEIPAFFVEKRYSRRDGGTVWVRVSASVRRDGDGRPFQIVGLIEDIDQRKRVELELEQRERELRVAKETAEEASRTKSEFLANMSHEIRTPMTVFLTALEHLQQIDRNRERRELLVMAEKAGQRLRALIDDILDFSRIEARRVEIDEVPFALPDTVGDAVDLLTARAQEKGLRLETEIDPGVPPLVVGDPDRLEQVLVNLVGNAVKFTERGEVRVSIERRSGSLYFAVSDTGIGIPEERRGALFQSFSQVDGSRTRKFGGTGLGLAICKGLVELMGGEIGMKPREGGGSVFYFTLPLRVAQMPPVSGVRKAAPPPAARGARILLAEDDPAVREMLRLTLERHGWTTVAVETGREAVAKWREGAFDLVLMDIQMPEMDGLEATGRIRAMERTSGGRTRIIGLTAHALRDVHEQCLAAGMDGHLTKPVRIGELYSTIEQCLARGDEEPPAGQSPVSRAHSG